MQHTQSFMDLVQDALKTVPEVTVEQVKDLLEAHHHFALIDVREESEFAMNRLPHAVHLSRGIIEIKIEQVIPNKETEIVLYCGGGNRSALSAQNLQKMGYKNVKSMKGGFRAWAAMVG